MDQYDILLSVRGSQSASGEEDTLELLTEGKLMQEDDKYIIEYDDSAMSGYENTKTRVIVEGDRISLRRTGMIETEFVFTRSQRYEAVYDTPFGALQMSIMPTQVSSELSPDKGRLDLEYVIQVGQQSILNRLNIDYTMKN